MNLSSTTNFIEPPVGRRAGAAPSAGFESTSFAHGGVEKQVLRRGAGSPVLVIPEPPGPTPEVLSFARRVADAGFSVALPVLFGVPGRPMSSGYAFGSLLGMCVSREFSLLASHRASPVTEWLRALTRSLHAESGGRGVGAIGMCITGSFVLALMVDEHLMAPVLSQPALPLPVGGERAAALHVSPGQLADAKARARSGVPLLGLRFTEDKKCPRQRFETLRREFGARFEAVEINSAPGNPHGIAASAHSVLTYDYVDDRDHPTRAALERVLEFLREQLVVPEVS